MTNWNPPSNQNPGPQHQNPAGAPPAYGQPAPQPGYGQPAFQMPMEAARPGNGVAVAAMVLGICGLVFFWIPIVGVLLNLLAIILAAAGMGKANRIGGHGKGFAIAGLVCGIIGLLLSLWITVAVFIVADQVNELQRY